MEAETNAPGSSGMKQYFRSRPAAFAACVLFLVILFGVAFNAAGWNMWRLIFSWDDETLEVRANIQGKITGRGYQNDLDPARDDAFFKKLDELDMTPLLPSRLPDGFALENMESKIETDYLRWVMGAYTCGERRLQISVDKNTAENAAGVWSVEKDEHKPEIYERGGIKFYMIDNLSRSGAHWVDPPYVLHLFGNVSRDELRQMIDSMFERQ